MKTSTVSTARSGSARRGLCIAALAALLAPLLVFLCVMLMGELAMLPLPA